MTPTTAADDLDALRDRDVGRPLRPRVRDRRPDPTRSRSCRAWSRRTSTRSPTATRCTALLLAPQGKLVVDFRAAARRRRRGVARLRARLRRAARGVAQPVPDPGEGRDRRPHRRRSGMRVRAIGRRPTADVAVAATVSHRHRRTRRRGFDLVGPTRRAAPTRRRRCVDADGVRGVAHRGRRPACRARHRRDDDRAGGVPRAATRCRSRRAASSARSWCAASTPAAT